MDLTEILVMFLIPIIFIIGGLIMWKATPKKNFFIGWRTRIAMKSEENFKIANEHGGKAMLGLGIAEAIVAAVIAIFSRFVILPEWTMLYVISIQTIALLVIIIAVEAQLRKELK